MKKWIALVLLASLVLTLSACGVDDIKIPTPVSPQPEQSQSVETLPPTDQKSPYEEALEQGCTTAATIASTMYAPGAFARAEIL